MIGETIHVALFLAVTGLGFYLFWQVVYRRYLYVKLGQPVELEKQVKERLRTAFVQVFGQTKLLKDKRSGVMHIVVFYGFIVLQLGALDLIYLGIAGQGLPIPGRDLFGAIQEITAASVLLAIFYAAYRRYIEKVQRLKKGWKPGIVIFFIVFLMISILLTTGFHRADQGLFHFSWMAPLSSILSVSMKGAPETVIAAGFFASWWLHLLILLAFLLYVPQSKHFHLITAPINILLRKTKPVGRLKSIDLDDEETESYGVGKIEQFDRKQLIDLYACVECGRCTNVCPASNTGKILSPMHLVVKLRDHLTEKGSVITSKSPWVPGFAFGSQGQAHRMSEVRMPEQWPDNQVTNISHTMNNQIASWRLTDQSPVDLQLVGDVITEDELWACTTCRNCEDQCPVGNEHVDKIVDMRRHLVLMEGSIPQDGQRALQNIERQGNPWGISRNDRVKWVEEVDPDCELSVPTVKQNPNFEYLFFVGSMGSYDNRSRKVTRAFVQLLNEANVNFAILGNEEKNSGDTPRRMGNEFLFQQLCAENIELFKKYKVGKIVTACPHTFNTLKNEYPEFGLEAEVYHHTQLLDELVREGKLMPRHPVQERITYHDSCYLGRYNDVYDQPRNILKAIPGVELVEMERSRENGMCCGAGGGMMWMEESAGKRVNLARTEQALAVKPSVISSACPYCLTMMEDGTKITEVEDAVSAKDIAELLAQSVFGVKAMSRQTIIQ